MNTVDFGDTSDNGIDAIVDVALVGTGLSTGYMNS
tara:strand:- start:96 stop:200 length:105 start_codon:yes stop_codon:yes gene_type:complete